MTTKIGYELQTLLEALKSAAYYIERLEAVHSNKPVRDLAEAQAYYRRLALALLVAYEREGV